MDDELTRLKKRIDYLEGAVGDLYGKLGDVIGLVQKNAEASTAQIIANAEHVANQKYGQQLLALRIAVACLLETCTDPEAVRAAIDARLARMHKLTPDQSATPVAFEAEQFVEELLAQIPRKSPER